MVKVIFPGRESDAASCSYKGAMALHGPHHGAQKSMATMVLDWTRELSCEVDCISTMVDMIGVSCDSIRRLLGLRDCAESLRNRGTESQIMSLY